MANAILLISCPDNKGITASVTQFVFQNYGNILHADQHTDDQTNTFFMRIEWSMKGFALDEKKAADAFEAIAKKFDMDWKIYFTDQKPRIAVFVSKYQHCLYDLLYRHQAGHLKCDIAMVISNHRDAKEVAEAFGIKFHEIPITKDNKAAQDSHLNASFL
jgi:formyltetrahydrofolate deformylase